MNRRSVLKLGVAGALVLSAAGVGLALQPSRPEPPEEPLLVLSPLEYGVLFAVAETLMPGGDGLPTARALRVAPKVDIVLSTLHPADAAQIRQVLRLIENAVTGLLLDGRPVPFTAADPDARLRTLERWRTSRWPLRRTAYQAVAGLCHAAYWSDPAIYAAVGYGGPPAWLTGGLPDAR